MEHFIKLDPAEADRILELAHAASLGDPEAEALFEAVSDREFQTALRIREMRQRQRFADQAAAAKQPAAVAADAGDGRGLYRLQRALDGSEANNQVNGAGTTSTTSTDVGRGWTRISAALAGKSG